MSGLGYVGKLAVNPTDITNRLAVNTALNAAMPNRASVSTQAASTAASYGSKTYIDTQDNTFVLPSYYQSQDALNVALSSVGQPNGAAALDSGSHVPLAQMPTMGAGYVLGPYGTTATATGTTAATPMKIADFSIGLSPIAFRAWVFMNAFVTGTNAHPIIEVGIANSTTAVAYSAMTIVARGEGRSLYNDYHSVSVVPVPDTTAETPSNLAVNYNIWLSAWLWDANNASVSIAAGNIASAAALLIRGAQ